MAIPPNDLPPPGLPTPAGALRRSLIVWGWGQAAAGRHWFLVLAGAQATLLAGLAVLGPPMADGPGIQAVFLAGTVVLGMWAVQALHAYRLTVRRRVPFGLSGGDGHAIEVLWLVPLAVVLATAFWGALGRASSPGAVLDRYVNAWDDARPADAVQLFVTPVDGHALAAVWQRQAPRLRNGLVLAAASIGEGSGIDPDRPFDSLRFDLLGASANPEPDGTVRATVRVVRSVTRRGTFLGFVPTTSQEVVPVLDLGRIDLRLVPVPGPVAGVSTEVWQIESIALLDETLGSPGG